METQLFKIRNKLLDSTLLYSLIFIFPILFASLIRIFHLGWISLFYFHFFFTVSITLLYIFRKKLSLRKKTFLFSAVYYLFSFVGSIYFGLAAGLFFYIFVLVINTIVLGRKYGVISLVAAFIGLLVASILHSSGIVVVNANLNVYTSSFNSWVSYILAFMFVLIVIINTIRVYNDFFTSNIEALKQKIIEYEIAQNDLKNIKVKLEKQNEELKKLNEDNVKAKEKAEESDRLKTAFLQNVSHEIRTPLNAISGFSIMLKRPDLTEEKRNNFVSIIVKSSNQLLSIVTDILTLSSIEKHQSATNIEKVFINDIVDELFALYKAQAESKGLSISVQKYLIDKQSEVYTDKVMVTQILTNLLNNAIKFTNEGFISFGYSLKNQEIEFFVTDTGIGISLENHDKIFENFRQVDMSISKKYNGSGLGLSISKGFVELLGGKIWVQSTPEKGSTFYFTIPYKPVLSEINLNTPFSKS